MPDFWISNNGFVTLKGIKMSPTKREDVRLKIIALQAASRTAGDLNRLTSQAAYELLYPEQVDYRSFLELWELSLSAPPESPTDALPARTALTPSGVAVALQSGSAAVAPDDNSAEPAPEAVKTKQSATVTAGAVAARLVPPS